MSTPPLFKWRHFQADIIILLNVRWYCRYALSYRNLEEMMLERGVEVDHSTINRWVLKYAPELDKVVLQEPRLNRRSLLERSNLRSDSEYFMKERDLSYDISFINSPNLSFADHIHGLEPS